MAWDFTADSDKQTLVSTTLSTCTVDYDTYKGNMFKKIDSMSNYWTGSDEKLFNETCHGYDQALVDLGNSIRMFSDHFSSMSSATVDLASQLLDIINDLTKAGAAGDGSGNGDTGDDSSSDDDSPEFHDAEQAKNDEEIATKGEYGGRDTQYIDEHGNLVQTITDNEGNIVGYEVYTKDQLDENNQPKNGEDPTWYNANGEKAEKPTPEEYNAQRNESDENAQPSGTPDFNYSEYEERSRSYGEGTYNGYNAYGGETFSYRDSSGNVIWVTTDKDGNVVYYNVYESKYVDANGEIMLDGYSNSKKYDAQGNDITGTTIMADDWAEEHNWPEDWKEQLEGNNSDQEGSADAVDTTSTEDDFTGGGRSFDDATDDAAEQDGTSSAVNTPDAASVTYNRGDIIKTTDRTLAYFGTTSDGINVYRNVSSGKIGYIDSNGEYVETTTDSNDFINGCYVTVNGDSTCAGDLSGSVTYTNGNDATDGDVIQADGYTSASMYIHGSSNSTFSESLTNITSTDGSQAFIDAINNHDNIMIDASGTVKVDPSGICNTATLSDGRNCTYLAYNEETGLYYLVDKEGNSLSTEGYLPEDFLKDKGGLYYN